MRVLFFYSLLSSLLRRWNDTGAVRAAASACRYCSGIRYSLGPQKSVFHPPRPVPIDFYDERMAMRTESINL